jgi:hypothetical protein
MADVHAMQGQLDAPERLRPAAPGRGLLWNALLDLDFTRPWAAALLSVIFVGARLPFISLGYGSDPDAWRVAMSARYLLLHGAYLPSRLPGYPLHDIAMAALIWGGSTLTNLATVAAALAGVFCFAAIVKRLRLPAAGLLTLTFAFLPLLWPTSTETLDYSWALTLLLGSYLALLGRRPAIAGLLLGLAGGCRVTYLAFGLPLALLILQDGRPRDLLRFLGVMLGAWMIVFSPVWFRYGFSFWNFYDVRPGWGDFFRSLTEGSVGLLSLIVLVVCLAVSWRELRRLPRILSFEPQAGAWAMIALLALFVFVRLPLQTYYLMPAAPFALLLLSRIVRKSLLVVVCLSLLLGGVVDVYTVSSAGWRSPAALLGIRPAPGLILQEYQLRQQRLSLVQGVPSLKLPPGSVLTAGFYFPMVAEMFHDDLQLTLPDGYLKQVGPLTDTAQATAANGVTYVWLLSEGDARTFLLQGHQIYTLDFARETNRPLEVRIYQADTERFGIH